MMQEFRQILNSPKASAPHILQQTQDFILKSFEKIFPETFDFSKLHEIYYQVLGENSLSLDQQIPISIQEQASLNYRLLQFLVESISNNFIDINNYQSLEEQTQKAEATIRTHIKVEHEMKMYLDYLEAKVQRYQKMIEINKPSQNFNRQIHLLASKQVILQREKLNLLKKNEQLKMQIQYLHSQLDGQSNDTVVIQDKNNEKIGVKIENLPDKVIDNMETFIPEDMQNKIKYNINYTDNLKSLNSPSALKDLNKDGSYLVPDYNNEVTQKKRSHFWR